MEKEQKKRERTREGRERHTVSREIGSDSDKRKLERRGEREDDGGQR